MKNKKELKRQTALNEDNKVFVGTWALEALELWVPNDKAFSTKQWTVGLSSCLLTLTQPSNKTMDQGRVFLGKVDHGSFSKGN